MLYLSSNLYYFCEKIYDHRNRNLINFRRSKSHLRGKRVSTTRFNCLCSRMKIFTINLLYVYDSIIIIFIFLQANYHLRPNTSLSELKMRHCEIISNVKVCKMRQKRLFDTWLSQYTMRDTFLHDHTKFSGFLYFCLCRSNVMPRVWLKQQYFAKILCTNHTIFVQKGIKMGKRLVLVSLQHVIAM